MTPTNQEIAKKLREHASDLARKGDNLYRVRAFRQAAMAVLALPEEVAILVATNGPKALERLPGVGKSLASTIAGYLGTGEAVSGAFQLSG
jgi:DNA polymerase (family 10)